MKCKNNFHEEGKDRRKGMSLLNLFPKGNNTSKLPIIESMTSYI